MKFNFKKIKNLTFNILGSKNLKFNFYLKFNNLFKLLTVFLKPFPNYSSILFLNFEVQNNIWVLLKV